MCGRNIESLIVELDHEMANCQQKRYVVMKFIHDEKHIVFNDVGKGRRRKVDVPTNYTVYLTVQDKLKFFQILCSLFVV